MGISRLTVLIIQRNDDIIATAGGPSPATGKWLGWITHGEEKHFLPLLNTEPIYDTEAQAVQAMVELLDRIKKMPLSDVFA